MKDLAATIKRIEGLLEKATPGDWVTDGTEMYSEYVGGPWIGEFQSNHSKKEIEANASLCADLHNSTPALLKAIREACAEVAKEHSKMFSICCCQHCTTHRELTDAG